MSPRSLKNLNRHLLRQALDAVPAPALIIDASGPVREIVFANPALARVLGLQASELNGRSAEALAVQPFDARGTGPWQLRNPAGGSIDLQVIPLYEQPGRVSYWLLTATPATQDQGQGQGQGQARGARGQTHRQSTVARTMATTGVFNGTDLWARGHRDERIDVVTGIPGRQAFNEALYRDWAAARRDQRRISVVVFRVDALESYFTLFGRHTTDACLRKLAHAIANSLQRAGDLCARVGHDRFAILVQGADAEPVAAYAGRIGQRIRDLAIHHPRSPLARYVTVAWGLATGIPAQGDDEPQLLEEAEGRIGEDNPQAGSAAALDPADKDLSVDAG